MSIVSPMDKGLHLARRRLQEETQVDADVENRLDEVISKFGGVVKPKVSGTPGKPASASLRRGGDTSTSTPVSSPAAIPDDLAAIIAARRKIVDRATGAMDGGEGGDAGPRRAPKRDEDSFLRIMEVALPRNARSCSHPPRPSYTLLYRVL